MRGGFSVNRVKLFEEICRQMNFLFFISVFARRWPALFQPELRPIRPVLKAVSAPFSLASGRSIGGRVGQYLLSYHRFFLWT